MLNILLASKGVVADKWPSYEKPHFDASIPSDRQVLLVRNSLILDCTRSPEKRTSDTVLATR
jgi:hypothetical protein